MCYLLGLIFIIAAVVSLGKIEFSHFIMLCCVSIGFNIAGAIESVADAIKKSFENDNTNENDE